MSIFDGKVLIHLEKAETALKEAQVLHAKGYYDGARSRATVSSIQAFTAISLANRQPNDPQDLIERVKLFVETKRLPESAGVYFQAAMFARRDVDETELKAQEAGALRSIDTASSFLQAVKSRVADLQVEDEPDAPAPGR